jgi:hypothetical protein
MGPRWALGTGGLAALVAGAYGVMALSRRTAKTEAEAEAAAVPRK